MRSADPVLLTGASGYVGSALLPELVSRGRSVRCLARTPERLDVPDGVRKVRADVVKGVGLEEALEGVSSAYYLIHSMGRGSGPDGEFAARDREAAHNFAQAALRAGVGRVVYLGGLGPTGLDASAHLRSRHEVAEILQASLPDVVYVRAAMIIGSGSASFEMLRHLVRRLPAMITPRWVDTRTQPVALSDVIATLAAAIELEEVDREIQLGGADVLTYREMMARFATIAGRRPPLILPVPVLSPRLSSYWVSLFTPIERGLVEPLVDGLKSEMVVERAPTHVNQEPKGFDDAVKEALA